MEHFGAHLQSLFKALSTYRHDHELLDANTVVGMLSAVDDVAHRDGQGAGVHAPKIAVEGEVKLDGAGAGGGHGNGEDGVRSQLGLVRRSVQIQHDMIKM